MRCTNIPTHTCICDSYQAPVVGKLDNAIRWITFCLVDSVVRFAITYPLDSDLSVGYRYPTYIKLGPEHYLKTCMYILLISNKSFDPHTRRLNEPPNWQKSTQCFCYLGALFNPVSKNRKKISKRPTRITSLANENTN